MGGRLLLERRKRVFVRFVIAIVFYLFGRGGKEGNTKKARTPTRAHMNEGGPRPQLRAFWGA